MSAPRYLVIGASGLVGRHVRAALRGRDVVSTQHRDQIDGATPLDLADLAAVRELVFRARPGVIVVAGGEAWVERCEREPQETRRVNVDATRAAAEASQELGATLVVFSSEYVFDGSRGVYREDDAVAPVNEYGRQKVDVERIARATASHLVCRTSGVFGDEPARKNFVLQVVDALRAERPFVVPSDQLITPAYAPELARALVALLDAGVRGTIQVVGPEILDRAEFARRIARVFGLDAHLLKPTPTSEIELAAPRPLRAGLSDDALRRALGAGLLSAEDGLRELAARGT